MAEPSKHMSVPHEITIPAFAAAISDLILWGRTANLPAPLLRNPVILRLPGRDRRADLRANDFAGDH
jgi:hypothetical protein